jgi:hypothetical protein
VHAHVMRGQCKDSKKGGGGGVFASARAHATRGQHRSAGDWARVSVYHWHVASIWYRWRTYMVQVIRVLMWGLIVIRVLVWGFIGIRVLIWGMIVVRFLIWGFISCDMDYHIF